MSAWLDVLLITRRLPHELGPLRIVLTLPQPVVGEAYAGACTAYGGPTGAAYTWAVVSGTLPSGLTLAADGAVTGSPDTPGPSSAVVRVNDALGRSVRRVVSLVTVTAVAALLVDDDGERLVDDDSTELTEG